MVNTGQATEAYDNFSRYGGQYDNIDQVPGYADWAASNPDLVAYASQGFTSGRSSADSSQAMTDFMNEWRTSQEQQNAPDPNAWRTDRNASGQDIFNGMYGGDSNRANVSRNGTGWAANQYYGYDNQRGEWADLTEQDGKWMSGGREVSDADLSRNFSRIYGAQYGNNGGAQFGVDMTNDVVGGASTRVADQERITTGTNAWNEGYGTYRAFGEQATNTVDQQLNERRTNAALLGIDFEVNDEARQTMINDEFAGLWTAEDQASMDALAEFEGGGAPEKPTYDFTRGDAANAMTDQSGTSTLVTEGSGVAPTSSTRSLLDDEGTTTTLGA